jgi:hypothetical protein
MRALSFVFALSVVLPASVSAHAIFVPHQGGPIVMNGHGGNSVSSHGIMVWTDGTPSQRFQVLGVIRDERTDKVFDGSALHSVAIAKLVRAQGGDGVIVGAVGTAPVAVLKGGGGPVLGTPSFTDQGDVQIRGVTTDLVVIKSMDGA